MTSDPLQLLKQLEPAVRPAYASAPTARPMAPVEQQRFDELLARAQKGLIASGRPVTTGFQTLPVLSEQELTRLAAAADVAEASGARRALMLLDGRGFVLDVPNRLLSAELSADPSSRLVSLDTAVYVAGDEAPAAAPLSPPGGVAPPAVAEQLEADRLTAPEGDAIGRRPAAS